MNVQLFGNIDNKTYQAPRINLMQKVQEKGATPLTFKETIKGLNDANVSVSISDEGLKALHGSKLQGAIDPMETAKQIEYMSNHQPVESFSNRFAQMLPSNYEMNDQGEAVFVSHTLQEKEDALISGFKQLYNEISIGHSLGTRIRYIEDETAGSKKKEDWTEVSKEQLAEVKLPASFEKLKEQKSYFYHGENISDYELVQTAVALGKMELPTDEKKCIPDRAAMDAFEVLVRDQAAPKNSWSNTLYSEDGKYTFTKTESGRWQMHLIDDAAVGASLEDIANWMMSGTPNRNIETRYLNYLHTVDPDLYNVAMRIGSEVRTYGFMEDLHQQGILSDSQNQYDMSLLGMLFGKDADSMRMLLHGCKESGNFLELLDLYSPDGAKSLDKLREQQYKHGGIV